MFYLTIRPIFKISYLLQRIFSSVDIISSYFLRLSLFLLAPASYAQARIWLDERIRIDSNKQQVAIHNMPFLYHLARHHSLSIKTLRHALKLIINKHQSLRTSLVFDAEKNLLLQQIINSYDNDINELFTFIESVFETEEQLNNIMNDEYANSQHFNLTSGIVFRCHIIYYKQISQNNLLGEKDALIFNFHHAVFDFQSMNVFLDDLNQAYTTGQLSTNDDTTLRYLDCKYNKYLSELIIFFSLLFRCYH
jgi:condensation domain-containing protein